MPKAGDLVWADLRPTRGGEQSGARPVVVLSDLDFHRRSRLAIICPITSNSRPWPTKVPLPAGLAATGSILVDQIRAVDRRERGFRHIGEVPEAVLNDVRAKLAALVGIESVAIADWR
ncbi:MAG: type II toxin-antitoxin system PemK/MazF family toxin [Alphaproteobacteria bacterium]|nr:MAG: type II toxin-antitoxin system PemK/MazF family toxin [Alphaproteobacteria bacterium]